MKIFSLLLTTLFIHFAYSQSPGDTIVVQSFDYTMTTGANGGLARAMMVPFPDNPGISYSKVLMLYNMRCRNGAVNTTGGNYVACGEWDYSCNSYIHDSTRVDSIPSTTASHKITGYNGTSYNYSTTPIYNYYLHIQQAVILNNIVSENQAIIGTGTQNMNEALPTASRNAKSVFLFTQSELSNAGLTAGNIDALLLNVLNAGGDANYFRVRLKETSDLTVDLTNLNLNGFSEVFYANTNFTNGQNRIQFYTPFTWNGTDNLLVEFSFTNPNTNTTIEIEGSNILNMGAFSSNDSYTHFNGSNYIEADTYKGISGNTNRTIEAWIKADAGSNSGEICSWGTDVSGEKWVTRINGDGTLRAEINGGFKYGTTLINDGQWHHIAIVLNGNNVTDCSFYVDGQLESTGGSQSLSVNTDTNDGIKMRISRGVNNRYFDGIIDELRLWGTNLSATEISNWSKQKLNPTHPNYADLETYLPLNEGQGTTINDLSTHSRNGEIINGEIWEMPNGLALFKDFQALTARPNLTFAQGTYNLTISNDSIVDSIQQVSNLVNEYQINSNAGTILNDEIATASSNYYWEASYSYFFDENGVKTDSTIVTPNGTINISDLDYFQRMPMRFEIISFVTPYGVNLNLGATGKTWQVDLTDYMPVLKGDKLMTIERGGQWNEDLDIKFLFIVGTPPRDIVDVQQIWRNDYKSYTSIMDNSSFEPRDVLMNPAASAYKLKSVITGHGQEGEFIPRDHFYNIDGGANEFQWTVWTACAENPIYPQGGTWIYDRAGWCPGKPSDLEEYDLTPFVTPGQTHTIDYGIITATGTSNYIVNNQLVSYGAPNFSLDAALVDILDPSSYVEYERFNSICANPTVVIQNTGSTALTSLTIEYWINSSSTLETFTWTGNLAFLEKAEVDLPSPGSLWQSANPTNNKFNVTIKNPNGGTDEFIHNNTYQSEFNLVDILPEAFYLNFKTNNAPHESKIELFDDAGNVIFTRTGMSSNTTYKDTFELYAGCYTLLISDSDGDGINFWANSDGSGSAFIKEVGGFTLKSFNGDFGGSIIYNFSVDSPLSYDQLYNNSQVELFPNPAQAFFTLSADNIDPSQISIHNGLGQNFQLPIEKSNNQLHINTQDLAPGLYIVNIKYEGETITKRLIIQ
ncbi:hypothetical protein DNU06_00115 [Putridiphycobacter roseus]|uniref:LamG-like jellyroll fold domain-containing protein n=1 Tax=Putridiphycobacter roseus TaxID=2219161 RepID=A0A2W1NFL3_9FLAO|nr:LamG-like jellyroll fold domain-containing protein [Putridiphycobacter roseus]PZE18275.1 hypothetical protein DNU06_00115 [Putridiphycobacter roseus]